MQVRSFASTFKRHFAASSGLDEERLTTDRAYKELHRFRMNAAFEEFHRERPSLCTEMLLNGLEGLEVLIVSDLRLVADAAALRAKECAAQRVVLVRVNAEEASRREFGWSPSSADQHWTETQLDDYGAWDFVFENNPPLQRLHQLAASILHTVDAML